MRVDNRILAAFKYQTLMNGVLRSLKARRLRTWSAKRFSTSFIETKLDLQRKLGQVSSPVGSMAGAMLERLGPLSKKLCNHALFQHRGAGAGR